LKGGRKTMKRRWLILLIACLLAVPAAAEAQVGKIIDDLLGGREQGIRAEDLKVLQLEFSPDPVREGQRMVFRTTISNGSRRSGRVSLSVRDRDQIVSEARDVTLRPGDNQVVFPEAAYRFSASDHCFVVEADIARTRTPIDVAREYCAKRTYAGWTLSDTGATQLYVEDLQMYPDPVSPGQEVRFSVKLRNDGRPIRGDIRIQDGNQTVVQTENATIPRGLTEYQFPRSQYTFQRFDTCFTVVVDSDRTRQPVDASKQYCAKPMGWTLRPGMREYREERVK
jgi:hypothetical protein